jgi:hypothetical protein
VKLAPLLSPKCGQPSHPSAASPLTLSPSHPLTLSPSHPLTLSPSHPLPLSPSHPLTRARLARTAASHSACGLHYALALHCT